MFLGEGKTSRHDGTCVIRADLEARSVLGKEGRKAWSVLPHVHSET